MQSYEFQIEAYISTINAFILNLAPEVKNYKFANCYFDHNNEIDPDLRITDEQVDFSFDGHNLTLLTEENPKQIITPNNIVTHFNYFLVINCNTAHEAQQIFSKFVKEAIKLSYKKYIPVWAFINQTFKLTTKLPLRKPNTFYTKTNELENILTDAKKFYDCGNEYREFGIPHTKKYLLTGPPGSGKTSLISIIASELNKHIYKVDSLGTDNNNNNTLVNIMHVIRVFNDIDIILVFENIDKLFLLIDQSEFFSIINGFDRKEGMAIFLTTQVSDVAEKLGPEQIDYRLNLTLPNETQVKKIFTKYFPNKVALFEEFYSKINGCVIKFSILERFFFEHRNDDMLAMAEELKHLLSKKSSSSYIYH